VRRISEIAEQTIYRQVVSPMPRLLDYNRTLRYLIEMVGVEQVLIGSDYPFMGRAQLPGEEFDALGLSDTDREAMSWRNCMRFLGSKPDRARRPRPGNGHVKAPVRGRDSIDDEWCL
jgi:predicted TIM-barrel fold metal-dependent hydrolase